MTNQIFLAYDGDNAGRLVGRAILADDAGSLSEVSQRINLGHEVVQKWVEEHGGKVISGGGDEGLFSLPAESVHDVEELRRDYEFATNLTMSVGVGQNLSQAGKSLLVAKFRGKNRVVLYDDSVEQDVQNTQARLSQGQGSDEEKKLGEAYLSKDPNQKDFKQDSWQVDQIKKEKTGQTPAQLATESPEQKEEREVANGSAQISSDKPQQANNSSALSEESPQQATAKTNAEAAAKVAENNPHPDNRPGDADGNNRIVPPQTGAPNDGLPPKHKEKEQEEAIGQSNKHVIGKEMSTPREKAEATGQDPEDEVLTSDEKERLNMKPEEKPQKKDEKNEKSKEAPQKMPQSSSQPPQKGQEAPQEASAKVSASPEDIIAELTARIEALESQLSGPAPDDDDYNIQDPSQQQSAQTIKQDIDNPPSDPKVEDQQMNNIDSGAMPIGHEQEGNVSRPDGFKQQNVPGDLGVGQSPAEVGMAADNPEDTQDDILGQENFQDNNGDEENPDNQDPELSGVMQDGLDASADDEQANNVKQMIGQALDGFKNNKHILERAQQQAPELYSSCIAMLKAMIEMAHMLGIADGSEQIPGEEAVPGQEMPGQEEAPCPTCGKGKDKEESAGKGGFPPKKDSKEGFPKKDGEEKEAGEEKGGFPPKKENKEKSKDGKSAAPKEGPANESPKGNSSSSKGGLGKLPTKATTQHVPRTPLSPGAINTKGQQKTIDQKTGKTRWIDRKKGAVMGPAGVPIKGSAQEQQ